MSVNQVFFPVKITFFKKGFTIHNHTSYLFQQFQVCDSSSCQVEEIQRGGDRLGESEQSQ